MSMKSAKQGSILYLTLLLVVWIVVDGCKKKQDIVSDESLGQLVFDVDSLVGKAEYLTTPYVTAGDRVYMIGTQDGQFPDLGWHVPGEMGGIWDHPIKLLDGFTATMVVDGKSFCLDKADKFINYPFANKHLFSSPDSSIQIERFQYVPDGQEALLVEYTFHNKGGAVKNVNFEWTAFTDLRPTWLGDSTGMRDGQDFVGWDNDRWAWVAKDTLNPWFVMMGATVRPASHGLPTALCQYEPKGKGARAALVYALEIPAHGSVSLPITIAGSYTSLDSLKQTYTSAQKNAVKNLVSKKVRYADIASKSMLTIPDKELQTAFRWGKYTTDWLVRDVPELGRGLSAGLPDYPWWFGVDNEYTLQGVLATGRFDLAQSTAGLLHSLSEKNNGNGRIIHEVSTNGTVFNPGNVNETPQFTSLIWQMYLWTGDRKLLAMYYPTIKKGLQWLLDEKDRDGNLLPDGFGMMEIHGMDSEMIDVAVYTQLAFADAAEMALVMGEKDVAEKYRQLARQLKQKINSEFWVPGQKSFADFIASPKQALQLLDDAVIRADTLKKPWSVAELKASRQKIQALAAGKKQGFVLHHNWVVNTPMQTGVADTAKALAALATGSRYVNPYGVFVTGIDRPAPQQDETAEGTGSFGKERKVFSYVGAVMTLPTGVQAVAENNYGRPDSALKYLKKLTKSFSYALPGSIYEVSPDYGMMAQAWNLYSLAVPIVGQFFGIKPRAADKIIRIQPQMPSSWNEASLDKVIIGTNQLTIHFLREVDAQQTVFEQTQPDWKLHVAYPAGRFRKWEVNGKAVQPKREGNFDTIEVSGVKVVVRVE